MTIKGPKSRGEKKRRLVTGGTFGFAAQKRKDDTRDLSRWGVEKVVVRKNHEKKDTHNDTLGRKKGTVSPKRGGTKGLSDGTEGNFRQRRDEKKNSFIDRCDLHVDRNGEGANPRTRGGGGRVGNYQLGSSLQNQGGRELNGF